MRRTFLSILVVSMLGVGIWAGCGEGDGDPPVSWWDAPIVPEMDGPTRERFLADIAVADSRGRIPDVFAKVGDSNTELPPNLYGFGCRPVGFGEHGDLAAVVERYKAVGLPLTGEASCTPVNSFSRLSVATRSGSFSTFPTIRIGDHIESAGRAGAVCGLDEAPVDCEIRLTGARYTIVMTGTNDLVLDSQFTGIRPGTRAARRLALLIARIRAAGSVPVLSNLPPAWVPSTPTIDEWGGVIRSNQQIQDLATEAEVPLINLWGALTEQQMIDHGLRGDGVHLSVYPNGGSTDPYANSVVLTEEALRHGANRRNLIWLQTLAELDRVAAEGA